MKRLVLGLVLLLPWGPLWAAPGGWPEPRQNPRLTTFQELPAAMKEPPVLLAEYDLGRGRPAVTPVFLAGDRGWVGVALLAGALQAYNPDGTLRWQSHPPGLNFTGLVASGDLDGGGRPMLLLRCGRPAEPFGAAVLLAADNGEVLWRYDVDPMSYSWSLLVGSYVPGASGRQIIVLMQGYPPEKDNGYIALFDFPRAAAPPVQKWRYDFDEYTCFPSLFQANLDGSGKKDLAVVTHSRMWVFDPATGKKKQFIQWDVAPGNVRSYGLVEFVDLNGDGRDDFLCIANFSQHHEVLLNVGGKLQEAWHHGWAESVTTGKVATSWPLPAHGDIDGDGRQEIVLSMYNSQGEGSWMVRVYDAMSGELKYSKPGFIAAALAHLDADGAMEIVADISDDSTAARPDGGASPSDHKGACVLKAIGGELKVIWQDKDARAVRALDPHGPQFIHNGTSMALRRGDGGKIVASPWLAPVVAAPVSAPVADFSKVPATVGPGAPELLAADLYGVGRNDLLVYRDATATILRLRDRRSFETVGTFSSACLPCVADLDGDGVPEILIADAGAGRVPVVKAISPAAKGKVLWETRFADPVSGLPAPRTAYLRAGHFTGRMGADIYAWLGSPAVQSTVLDGHDGQVVWQKQQVPGSERYWGPSVNLASVCDFNGDGKDDLVFTNPDYFCIASGNSGELLSGPSFPPQIFHQPSQGLYTLPSLLPELGSKTGLPIAVSLVAGHYFQAAMSLDGQPHWHKLPPIGEARCAQEGFAPKGDHWLMGFGRQNGKFACVTVADGSLRWELDVHASCTDAVSCDIDGSGNPAFIFGTSHGQLYAVQDRAGAAHVIWKLEVGTPLIGSPILADLSGAGRSQILITGAEGRIRLYGNAKP